MNTTSPAVTEWLEIQAAEVAHRIETSIREIIFSKLKRQGAVVGVSGGIDSSVVVALCARALGKERVLALQMPERECAPESQALAQQVIDFLQVRSAIEDITPSLEAAQCYQRRDDAIRAVVPEFGPGYRCKLVIPELATGARYPLPSLVVAAPDGSTKRVRLSAAVYLEVVAASNFKQRARKMMEYYYADRYQYAVIGTPNRLEFDQGFFVKNGDGAADLKPIAHLYKSQVYQLAEYLGIPAGVRQRPSTTDTFSMSQSQEEFFFSVPLQLLDICLYGKNHGRCLAEIAHVAGVSIEHAQAICEAIDSKRRATRYLHAPAICVEDVLEVAGKWDDAS